MALAFRSNDMTENATAGASCVVTAPAGIADGDILVFAVERAVVTGAIIWPSGFNELWDQTHFGGSNACSWKRAASESGDYTASWTGDSRNVGIIFAISGAVATGDPTTLGTIVTGTGTSIDPPSSDPGSSAARLAVVVIGQEGKNSARFTPDPAYTEPANADGGTSGAGPGGDHCGLTMAYRTYTGQAEDPGAWTSSVNDGYVAQTIVFDPEPGGGPPTQRGAVDRISRGSSPVLSSNLGGVIIG